MNHARRDPMKPPAMSGSSPAPRDIWNATPWPLTQAWAEGFVQPLSRLAVSLWMQRWFKQRQRGSFDLRQVSGAGLARDAMRVLSLRRVVRPILLLVAGLVVGGGLYAQRGQRGGGGGFYGGGQIYVPPGAKTARDIPSRSTGTPEWAYAAGFTGDVFTFARLRYDAAPRPPTARSTSTTRSPGRSSRSSPPTCSTGAASPSSRHSRTRALRPSKSAWTVTLCALALRARTPSSRPS